MTTMYAGRAFYTPGGERGDLSPAPGFELHFSNGSHVWTLMLVAPSHQDSLLSLDGGGLIVPG